MSQTQSSEIYVGLMSGTSLDGVDVAVVDFSEYPPRTLHGGTTAYDPALRLSLRELTHSQTITLDALYRLDAELSRVYAGVVTEALDALSLPREAVAALGCHGQTIRHRPDADPAYTAQLGDPGRLAILSGICTVADFRRKDMALGGQGAPLAPAFHQFLLRSDDETRVVVNIGGIANVTCLPADPDAPVYGFDTGPGNTLMDHWVAQHLGETYDRDGAWARSGEIISGLLAAILQDEPYFHREPPKSTGTEYFDLAWLTARLDQGLEPRDVQATLAELTAVTIGTAIRGMPAAVDRCFVCGGGAHNRYLLERLQKALGDISLSTTANIGIDPDYVEASAFAWLARCRLKQEPGNLPSVTGASRATVLGGVYPAI